MATSDRSLVLCFLLIFCVGCAYCETVYAETGKNKTFEPPITGDIELGDWKHNGNLVVDWDTTSEPHFYPNYKGRASVNTKNGVLTLQVKKEDSGVFNSQIQIKGTLQNFQITLKVMDPVPQPKVSCTGAGNNLTLTCSVDSLVEAKFKWTGPNQFSHVGNTVHISREQNEAIYFCTAENEVSSKYMEFNLMDCPASEPESNVGAIVGSIFGVLAVAAVVGGVIIYKHKKDSPGRGQGAEIKGEEETSLKTKETSNSPDNDTLPQNGKEV